MKKIIKMKKVGVDEAKRKSKKKPFDISKIKSYIDNEYRKKIVLIRDAKKYAEMFIKNEYCSEFLGKIVGFYFNERPTQKVGQDDPVYMVLTLLIWISIKKGKTADDFYEGEPKGEGLKLDNVRFRKSEIPETILLEYYSIEDPKTFDEVV
jgi:hypothetical protein